MRAWLICLSFAACRPEARRFIAVGDTGRPKTRQEAVAIAMDEKCRKDGCDFVLMMGDNFYYSGVDGPDDPVWQAQFEQPYAPFSVPFYMSLGNHDYGEHGRGFVKERANYQVEHTFASRLWRMPARYYQRREGVVDLVALDTTAMLFQNEDTQRNVTRAYLQKSTAPWRIVFGHHPYLSDGPHGDAGNYDERPGAGAAVKTILEDAVCGNADLYLAGHEHNLQVLSDTCKGTALIVSGAGATTNPMASVHPTALALDEVGFVYFVATAEALRYDVITVDHGVVYSGTVAHVR